MQTELITPAVASVMLVALGTCINAGSTWDRVGFKVCPVIVGIALGFQTYGRFMGWPV